MKYRFVFSLCGIALLAPTSAWAQDSGWSGAYVGVTVGAIETSTQNLDNWCWVACDAPLIRAVKPSIGGTIGVNQQVDDNLVLGLEADFNTGGAKSLETPSYGNSIPKPRYLWTSDYKWTSSIRARAGLNINNSMAYVTGGYALSKATFSEDTQNYAPWLGHPGPYGASWSGTLTGYTYGVGIEHKFKKFSTKAEVLHSSYSIPTACFADTVGPAIGQCIMDYSPNEPQILSFAPTTTMIRIGLNYRF